MQSFFPIGEQAHWHKRIETTDSIMQWLFDPVSLTAKLKQISSQFKLEILGETWFKPGEFDGLNFDEPTLVREVLLYCQNQPWVFAHSQIPESTIAAGNQSLSQLGEQPLGEMIFRHPNIRRQTIEVAEFDSLTQVYKLAGQVSKSDLPDVLFGRRSLFKLADKPLTVSEIFLADCNFYHE